MSNHQEMYLRCGRASRELGISPDIFRKLCAAGVIPATATGPGRHWRVSLETVGELKRAGSPISAYLPRQTNGNATPTAKRGADNTPRIQVATVEIAVLRIGSKPMTQAVFQQLPTRHLPYEYRVIPFQLGGRTLGKIWGWIKYKGFHVIFEFEGRLWRHQIEGEDQLLNEYPQLFIAV
jgi:excisionase family DNA binding protein